MVILDAEDFRRLVIAVLEKINLPVKTLVTGSAMADRDFALDIASGLLFNGAQSRLMRSLPALQFGVVID